MPVPVLSTITRRAMTMSDTSNGGGPDPLDMLLLPPANETDAQRIKRLKEETSARLISDAIDEDINRARHARRKKTVKLLLLGSSIPTSPRSFPRG